MTTLKSVPATGLTERQLTDIVADYVKLLPNQYLASPKARATIAAASLSMASSTSVVQALAYNVLNLTVAQGISLDYIGAIVGISRDYVGNYSSTIGDGNKLYDQYYATLIATKIVLNYDKCSYISIANAIYSLYNGEVYMETNYEMDLTFYVPSSTSLELLQILLQKDAFLVPAGVLLQYLTVQLPVFAYIDYFLIDNPDLITSIIVGMTDYANYSTAVGHTLTYQDIES